MSTPKSLITRIITDMSNHRRAANIDKNQNDIVEALRALGCSVHTGVDDILCGFQNLTFWYELKSENAVKKDGLISEKAIKPGQKKIRSTWRGHYRIVASLEQIIDDMNETFKRCGLRTVKIK